MAPVQIRVSPFGPFRKSAGEKKKYYTGAYMFYVYVLRCRDGSLYTGYTNSISKRLEQHNQGKAAKYTRGRRPVKLLLTVPYTSKSEALKAEIAFKKLSREEKLAYIKKSFKYLDKK